MLWSFSVLLPFVAASLKPTLVHPLQRSFYERKTCLFHRFLTFPFENRRPGRKPGPLRKLEMFTNPVGITSPLLFFFCFWDLDVWWNLTVSAFVINRALLLFREAASHPKASPRFALEKPFRGHCSHSSEVHVCRGTSPHPRVTSADFLTLIYL